MITVYQIIIGEIPTFLIPCIESVKKYAELSGYVYKVISELDESILTEINLSEVTNYRNICDFQKIKILSENLYSLVVDWDIFIDENIVLNDEYKINNNGDFFLYNGNNIDIFKEIKNIMLNNFISENKSGPLYYAWKELNQHIDTSNHIITNGFRHIMSNVLRSNIPTEQKEFILKNLKCSTKEIDYILNNI